MDDMLKPIMSIMMMVVLVGILSSVISTGAAAEIEQPLQAQMTDITFRSV